MLKAISIWAIPAEWAAPAQLPETFRRLRMLGFEGIELAFSPDGPIGFASTAVEMAQLRRAASEAGLAITSLASGAFFSTHFAQDDPAKRALARRMVVKMLELAQALGAEKLLVVPGSVDIAWDASAPVLPYDTVIARCHEGLRTLIPDCERTGVRIGVENVWNRCFLSPLEMRDFLDALGSPFIGAYFDVGNVLPTGYPEQWITILAHRIVAVHLKDFKRAVATLAGFVDLLEGDVNWPAVMQALHDVAYDGSLVAETGLYAHHYLAALEHTSNAMDWIMGRKSVEQYFSAVRAEK